MAGVATDSSTGFDLPDGSNRSPDAAWTRKSRLDSLPESAQNDYLPLCPDFVIELRSKSDRPQQLEKKKLEYLANGARLGWLIDPVERSVVVFREGHEPVKLENPAALSGDPELPGFILPMAGIW